MKSMYKKLGDYIEPCDLLNDKEEITLLQGISNKKYFQACKSNTNDIDLSRYRICRKGWFAYNRATTRNGDKISIAYRDGEDCLVSPSYKCFRIKDENELNPYYLMLWFKRPQFDRYARFRSHGSAHEYFEYDEMCEVELPIPSIEEQLKIVEEYQTLEHRIELKRQINDNLESQVSTLFYSITKDSQPNSVFSTIASIESGKRPNSNKHGKYPLIGAGGIVDFIDSYNYNEKILVTGRVGTHGVIQRFSNSCWASDNTLIIKSIRYEYAYQFLKKVDFSSLNRGSTQPLITQTDLKNLPIYLPDDETLNMFEIKAEKIMVCYEQNLKEIVQLEHLQTIFFSSLAKH